MNHGGETIPWSKSSDGKRPAWVVSGLYAVLFAIDVVRALRTLLEQTNMIMMYKAFFKISIVAALVCVALACGRKETPPQPKEQEDPTVTAVTALFKKWDEAFNSNAPDQLLEIIPNEVKDRNPEEIKKEFARLISELASLVRDVNTSVDRIVIENDEKTKATVYVTLTAVDLKTRKPSKETNSYPIIKEGSEWKLDIQRWGQTGQTKSATTEPKPKSGLVISLTYKGRRYDYHICHAEVYNDGDKTESISPCKFVLVTDSNESIEAQIPFERYLVDYKTLLNLHILPKTHTSGYLFFKTASPVQYIVFLPTGEKIPVSNLR